MRIQTPSFAAGRLLSLRRPLLRFALLTGGIALLSVAATACSGDDDDADATQATGGVATATQTVESTAAPGTSTTPAGGTLVPFDTPTPEPPAADSTGTPIPTVEMANLVPCGDDTYYEEQVMPNKVHVLTYKDVPEGTPILFPFKEGELRQVDSREGAMLVTYNVEGVGVFSVQAAGADSLERNLTHVTQGQVIGHFGGTFGDEDTDVFQGYQLFALAGKEELVQMGDQLFSGESLDPVVTGCLVLP
jgi:hypothetical protein